MNFIRLFYRIFILLILAAFTFDAQAQKSDPGDLLIGNWQPSNGRSVVSIYKGNPDNGEDPKKYYGKVVWLLEPNDENGQPRVDVNNPVADKRKDPLKGMILMKDLEFVGNSKERIWENGTIYDPNNGSTYSFEVKIPTNNDNLMEGRGYIGVSLFGRTDTWKRLVKKGK